MRPRCRTLVTKWQRAVKAVPLAKVLPRALGGVGNDAKVAAFFGDKVLGAAVALAQRRAVGPDEQRIGSLTELQSRAVSNEFMRTHFTDIMPLHAGLVHQHQDNSAHVGTMVEAAVTAVHDDGGHEAIADLA